MISVFGSSVGEQELEQVRESFEQQWLGMGPKTKTFEAEFSARLGLPNAVVVNSGSNALYAAIVLLDLPPGSDVIVPSFTWVACAHAVLLAGHRPVFCDVDLDTQNVTAETVARARTANTRAVLVVHYAGLPVDLGPILALGLPVVEDAAHAVDSKIGDRYCGSMGDVGVYSFDAVKNLVMGEGGAVTARDPARAERARLLRYCGIGKSGFEASTGNKDRWWEYRIGEVFPKLLASDISAGIGLAQLRRLDALQQRRRTVWETYQREFAGLDWLRRPADSPPQHQHSFFTYVIRIPNRDRSAKRLYERGIYTTLRYHPLHMNPIYQTDIRLENTEKLNEEAISIPLHPNLTPGDLDKIVTEVRALSRSW